MNHVFVDCENVPEVELAVIGEKAVAVTLLIGPKQTKLDVGLVERLLEHAESVQLVRLTSAAKNAVDFALAYYLGRAAAKEPTAAYHVVSKDKGYDTLIAHLRSRGVQVRRHDDFRSLPFSPQAKARSVKPAPTPVDLVSRVVAHLQKNPVNRPKRQKTLQSHLKGLMGKAATDTDIMALIETLRSAGHLSLGEKGAVTYHV